MADKVNVWVMQSQDAREKEVQAMKKKISWDWYYILRSGVVNKADATAVLWWTYRVTLGTFKGQDDWQGVYHWPIRASPKQEIS